MQRSVKAEANTSLKSNIMIWNSDVCYFKDHYSFYITFLKILISEFNIKIFKVKKFKPKKLKSADKKPFILPKTNFNKFAKLIY